MPSEFQSVSPLPIKRLQIRHLNWKGELKRHLSPLTVNKLLGIFPIYGRINSYEGRFIYIQVGLQIGSEKPLNTFKKGDLAFSPLGNFICIFLGDALLNQKMNLLGRITSGNIDILQSFRVGDNLRIERSLK
ncbi:MAG: cyclophilin-like family protein [Candidatus Nitrosocosmicus sp.]|nr:cyclophilin-like family protein [Candidatus Nitrosocosmicus sp.]